MKKRLLSALLALALVFVLLPTTALAGETTYTDSEITISGKYWNFGNKGTSGEYAPVYFQSNGTAFQESKPTGSNYLEIKKTGEKEITITVYGTVNLTENESSTNSCISVNSNGVNERNLIITGAAKGSTLNLTCKNNSHPLYSYEGSITINGGVTVNATSQCSNNNNYVSVYGIQVYKGGHNLTISGANTKVNVANKTYDSTVKVDGNITVSDGAQLKAENKSGKVTGNTSKKAYAIECGGQFSISGENTKVTADTSNGKKAISGTVNNGDKLTFKAANSKGSQIFLQRPMDEALGYAYVEITQAPTDPYVFIAGEPAIMGQETPIPGGSGTYLYVDAGYDGNILTLKDATINKTDSIKAVQAIRFGQNGYYTIKLEGENKISGFSSGIVAPNDSGVNNVTVVLSGSGSLDISANQYAIDMQVGKLKFENTGKIMLTTGYTYPASTLNALHVAGNVTIDKTKYDIVGVKQNIEGTRENISDNPNLDTILKGTDSTLYFKTITITPAPAKDSTISYGKKTLKQGEIIKGEISGTATVATKGNTITLNNFKGTQALSFEATLADSTLVLEGTSTLSSIVTTQKGLTISGSGSLTVGSIKVTNNDNIRADLTITDGAAVIAKSNATRAIDIKGDLTVTNGSLTATSNSNNVPTVQVGGNASFTGSTVTITNHSTALHKDAADATKGDSVSSALYVKGNINITDNANVTAKVENGGGNAIGALGNITVKGSSNVTAVNKGQKFTTIIAENVYVSGDSKITANNLNENPVYNGSYLAFPAIEGNIVNQNTDYSLKFEGQHNGTLAPKTTLAPGEQTTLYYYNVTITRGDEVARTPSPVVIDGTTLLNDTYYTITDGSTVVANGSKGNYNAIYDSANKTLKLNNAKISTTTENAAIKISEDSTITTITVTGTNELKGNHNHCIESYDNFTINGTGTLNMTNTNSSSSATSVIHCGPGKSLTIAAEVIIKNEDHPGKLILTVTDNAYSFAEGYNVYASKNVSGSPLEAYDAAKGSTYKYLRVTKENLTPTTPTTYTVTITGENISKYYRSEGELEQTVTAGETIKTVTVAANGGYYFPDNYVKDLELPSGITATVSGDNWYLTIKGIPSKDATINLPVLSKRPTITVDIPLPVAGNKPATIDQIHLTCDDPNYTPEIRGISWNKGSLTEESVAIGANDTFVAGTCYNVKIFLSTGIADGAYKLAYAGGGDNPWYAYWGTSNFQLYFQATPAATHEHNWAENYDTVYHWKMCTYDGCTAIKDKALHVWNAWHTSNNEQQHWKSCSECSYSTPPHDIDLAYVSDGEQGHHLYCKHDGCTFVTGTTAHVYAEGSNICTECGYDKSAPCNHTGDRAYTNNGDGTHKVTCKACGATIVEKQNHEFNPTGACIYCGATQSGGDPTPDNPGTIVIIRPAEEEKPVQQPNPSTGANDLVGLAVAAAVAAALGSAALLRKHD